MAPAPATAQYQYLNFKMLNGPEDPFVYYYDARDPSPVGLSLATVEQAVRRAFAQWDDVTCSRLAFSFQGAAPPERAADRYDVYNVAAVWVKSRSEPAYQDLLEHGEVTAAALPLTYAGVLQQCDIYLNAVDVKWSTSGQPAADQVDLETVLVHEVGHCIGMGHDTIGLNPGVMAPIVLGQVRRQLTARDVQALCERYPASGALGAPCEADGGCGANSALKCAALPKADGGAGSVCVSGCPLDAGFSCPSPFVCEPSTVFAPAHAGACVPPTGIATLVGKACVGESECGSARALCLAQGALPSGFPAWQGGYCSQACGQGQAPCPAGSQCVDLGGGVSRCMKECQPGGADCRPGYTCVPSGQGAVCASSCHAEADCNDPGFSQNVCRVCDGTCVAAQQAGRAVGERCESSAECGAGQICHPIADGTEAQCTQSCARVCLSCPAGSSCRPVGQSGELLCVRDCVAGTCPAGTRCAPLLTGNGCVPACKVDTECPVGTRCSSGECVSGADAGCALCGGDAGEWPGGAGDGGAAPGQGRSGCGCQSAGKTGGLGAWLAVLLLLRALSGGSPRSRLP